MINLQERFIAIKLKADLLEKGIKPKQQATVEVSDKTYGIWRMSIDGTVNEQKLFNIPTLEEAERAKACLRDKKKFDDEGFVEFLGWSIREEGQFKLKGVNYERAINCVICCIVGWFIR